MKVKYEKNRANTNKYRWKRLLKYLNKYLYMYIFKLTYLKKKFTL